MIDCGIEDIHAGMPVKVVFIDVPEEIILPNFRPVRQ